MRYRTIVADPPWSFAVRTARGRGKSPDRHYPCMTLSAICALPVAEVCLPDAALLLWSTWPTLPQAFEVIDAWNFTYRTGFPWLKMTRYGAVQMGCGYHVRACSEPILIATRGTGVWPGIGNQRLGVLFDPDGAPSGALLHPSGPHSAKPDTQYDIAERYGGPYLEMFARPDGGLDVPRPHWTRIGNEMTGRSIREDLKLLASLPQPHVEETYHDDIHRY